MVNTQSNIEVLKDSVAARLKKANALIEKQQNPPKGWVKTRDELAYRYEILCQAEQLLPSIGVDSCTNLHEKVTAFCRAHMVEKDKDFLAFSNKDDSEEAESARNELVSLIEVFDLDFDYEDEEANYIAFSNYIEGVVRYIFFFREKYTDIKTTK